MKLHMLSKESPALLVHKLGRGTRLLVYSACALGLLLTIK
jgi:hypothetical protein